MATLQGISMTFTFSSGWVAPKKNRRYENIEWDDKTEEGQVCRTLTETFGRSRVTISEPARRDDVWHINYQTDKSRVWSIGAPISEQLARDIRDFMGRRGWKTANQVIEYLL